MRLSSGTTAGFLLLTAAADATNSSPFLQRSDTGSPAWNAAIQRAATLISSATLSELNNLTYGFTLDNGCAGNSGSLPRLSFPGMCLHDGPAGAKSNLVTGFASGVSVAAGWNRQLTWERGYWMGKEFKAKGVQVANGPVVGPLGRTATGGRAWEGFGADPYLSGALGAETIRALQKSVISAVKHYILNEQETFRYSLQTPAMSSDADDQTLHEVYLAPFQDAVYAGAGSVMCAYNRVNGTYACENDRTLNQILKDELNFPGFVLSDWIFGQQSGLESAVGGLDMAMPASDRYWSDDKLVDEVNAGNLTKARLEDMAKRILSPWFLITGPKSGSLAPGSGLPRDLLAPHELVDGRDPASQPSTKQSAIEGHVLVKNINEALPLKKPKLISIFGWDAPNPLVNNPSPAGQFTAQSIGSQSVNISDAYVQQAVLGNPPLPVPLIADQGTLLQGGGSGTITAPYWVDPLAALTYRARQDQTQLYWDLRSIKPLVAQASDACLVFINAVATETLDRAKLSDTPSDELVQNVAASCKNTIVVIHNAWIRLVDDWIEHPNVTAVLFAHLPGQESGEALVDVLYGTVSPSGRLPYTVAKQESDYGGLLDPARLPESDGAPHAVFSEGVNIDYKHFLANSITPRFSFGYGLTYTTFDYSDFSVSWLQPTRDVAPPAPELIVPGGIESLFGVIARASVSITNTGNVPAAEVSQLYIQYPGEQKVRHLRGFSKDVVQPGQAATPQFDLTRRDLSRWNAANQQWELQKGEYRIWVGPNVEEASLMASLVN